VYQTNESAINHLKLSIMFRISLKIFLLILSIGILFVACEKDDIEEITEFEAASRSLTADESYLYMTAEDEISQDALLTAGGDRQPCFMPVFPVTLVFSDGSSLEVNSKEELKTSLREYLQENRGNIQRPKVQFPHDVELSDGPIVTVESREDVAELLKDCAESIAEERRCFKLIFPVTLSYPDGTAEEMDNKDELKEALRNWRADNPDSRERPQLQYPYQVEDQDGNTITLESDEAKRRLIMSCRPDRTPCLDWVFPITLIVPDGSTQEINSSDELVLFLMEWRDSNPDATERPKVQFPQDVQLENGRTITVESARQLAAITKACRRMHHRDRRPRRGNGPR